MSVRVMSWVWESSRSEGIDRLVLLAIADAAADHGGNAWPSVQTLVTKARVGERTVQRAVRRLVELGELEVSVNAGKNGVNVYRIIMGCHSDTPVTATPPSQRHPRQGDGVSESAPRGVTQTPPPRHSDTQPIQEPSLPIQSSNAREDAFEEFWRIYPRRVGKRGAHGEFDRALKRADLAVILAGAERYRDDPNRVTEFTKHPSTWLSQDCWGDDPLPARTNSSGSARASPANRSTTDDRVRSTLELAARLDASQSRKAITG